ncbi:hypothetical protein, partial [Motilibacter deserti]|uniref:hypothetical protein n=1 Tax=Motilibacter deserti TaxID=2714956 RepID=UPI001E483BA6
VAQDADGALSHAVGASGPTLVLVHADGVIDAVEPAPQDRLATIGPWLDERLPGLLQAGATS